MRILVVQPGASYATADVHDGLVAALKRAGHEVFPYSLDGRIRMASGYLNYAWRHNGRVNGTPKPTVADIFYVASQELPYRAARLGVDWTLVVTAMMLHPDPLILMRRAGQRVGLLLTESPYDDEEQSRLMPLVDIAWTNERASVPFLRQGNPNVHYLPHAYDPARHSPDDSARNMDLPAHDVVFVGTGFRERQKLLAEVDWSGIDLGLYGRYPHVGSRSHLRPYIREGVVSNDVAAALYRRARIGLNLYRAADGAESLNPRAVELAACGAFTISDYRAEVGEVFGSLVPTFRNAAELGGLVRRYLADEGARRSLADRLPAAVAGRTFDTMARQVVEQMQAYEEGR
jgi:hypothetical protein